VPNIDAHGLLGFDVELGRLFSRQIGRFCPLFFRQRDDVDAAPAMLGQDQRLLVPKTEEKRCAPWLDIAGGAVGGGGALRGGVAASGAAEAGRS
jgi:hypothetical protein